jgi:hypothetical protein
MNHSTDNKDHVLSSCPQCGYDIRMVAATGLCPECGLSLEEWTASERSRREALARGNALGLLSVALVTGSCCTMVALPRPKRDSPTAGAGTADPFVIHAVILAFSGWAAVRAIRSGALFALFVGILALFLTGLMIFGHLIVWIDALRT